jgi:hypothetical protein
LLFHPHLHCIVTGGGLNAARDRWIAARPGFLVPVRALSRVFRGKLLDLLDRSLQQESAVVGPDLGQRLLRQAAAKQWVVYSKAPMAGPAQVLRYRDRRDGNLSKQLSLAAPDFVRRFLLHVLPHGFVRVRHFGIQANVCRARLLDRARQALDSPSPAQPDKSCDETWQALFRRLTGRDPNRCPFCGRGTLRSLASDFGIPTLARGP